MYSEKKQISLLRKMHFFDPLPDGVVIKRATSYEELLQSYELIYETFIDNKYIKPNKYKTRIRLFEALKETAIFVATDNGKVVATQELIPDCYGILPIDEAFSDYINILRESGFSIAEASSQSVHVDYRNTSIPLQLMLICLTHAKKIYNCDCLLSAISPRHAKTYTKVLNFNKIGEERNFSHDILDTVALVNLNVILFKKQIEIGQKSDLMKDIYFNTPYVDKVEEWENRYKRFFKAENIKELFINKSNFINKLSESQLNILKKSWGNDIFKEVIKTK